MYDKFLTGPDLIESEATFTDGTKVAVFFKKCAHVDFERWRLAEQSGDPVKIERGKQKFIASCLVNPDGKRAMTDEQSLCLTAEGVTILFPLALEASGIARKAEPAGNDSGEAAANT